ncbi:MAG: GNAT family N-acetyltransferase [Pseudomonadota bacterium]
MQKPNLLSAESAAIPDVLSLIQRSFAFMDGQIDPPSSMHRLTVDAIAEHCRRAEVWTLGTPITACIFLTPKPEVLYVSKLAVDEQQRGRGLARKLIQHAEIRAHALNLPALELETRIELTENHVTFDRMGFVKTAEAAHDGYTRPTFIIMRKPLG